MDESLLVKDVLRSLVDKIVNQEHEASLRNERRQKRKQMRAASGLGAFLSSVLASNTEKKKEEPRKAEASAETSAPKKAKIEPLEEWDFYKVDGNLVPYATYDVTKSKSNMYMKTCKWSPDGRYLLTTSQDHYVRVFELNEQNQLILKRETQLPEPILAAAWKPPSLSEPPTYATSCKYQPVQLWRVEGEDHLPHLSIFCRVDRTVELDLVYSLAFSGDGEHLYMGLRGKVRIYSFTRKEKEPSYIETTGPPGIVSCFAENPRNPTTIAVGSYQNKIRILSTMNLDVVDVFDTEFPVTQLSFSPDGRYLVLGGKKNSEIHCFDGSKMYLSCSLVPAMRLERLVDTQQTIDFQLDRSGRYLLSGNTSGEILLYDFDVAKENTGEVIRPVSRCKVSQSALCGLSLHPTKALLATAHGQRVFTCKDYFSDSEEEDGQKPKRYVDSDFPFDNLVRLWNLRR